MNVAWLSVLLTLYWKPPIGEELLYTCFYMKDPGKLYNWRTQYEVYEDTALAMPENSWDF